MSSIETNNIKVSPPKPFRRRLSFKTKPSPLETIASSTSNTLGSGFNSVRGSIRRLRRTSNANGASNQNPNNDPNLTSEQAATSPTFPSFQRIREQTSRLKDINLSQIIVEFGNETAELGNLAKEAVVELWKKKKEEPPSNGLSLSHNSSPKNVAGISIFGAPLITAVRLTRIEKDINQIESDPYRYWLPAVMVRCIEFLDIYGLEEIGLYRIPGSALTVTRMKNIIDSGADLNFLQSSVKDPHAVATLLKTYLRELPELILTEALTPEFNACVAKYTNSALVATPAVTPGSPIPITSSFTTPTIIPEELPKALSNIASDLPPQHFYLLRALCSHLSRVNKKSGINKMNISNLGVVFCPTLGIGSILFKALVEHIDVVFGMGCKTERGTLNEEKKEQKAKERLAPEVYHKTNISDEFSRSFDDLLSLDTERVNCHSSNHSYSSSPSSSIIGLYVNRDIDLSNENQNDSVKNHVTNNVATTISPTLSSSSSITSPPTPPFKPIKNQQCNNISKDANTPFNNDEFLSSIDINQHQHTVNIIDTARTAFSSSSSKPTFRVRSRSTGLRDIPLTAFEYSSDSSDDEEKETKEKGVNSSPFMTFDYFDKHGIKNLGVLNLSPRSNWMLHHNGVGGDKSRATAAWVKRRQRRPSLEETEKWKKILLANINTTEPPVVIIGDDDNNKVLN